MHLSVANLARAKASSPYQKIVLSVQRIILIARAVAEDSSTEDKPIGQRRKRGIRNKDTEEYVENNSL